VPNRSANCATQQCLFGESHTLAFRSRRRSLRAGLVVIDAHVVTDAPPRKVEECRCRKELFTVRQSDALGAHAFLAVSGQPSVHGDLVPRLEQRVGVHP